MNLALEVELVLDLQKAHSSASAWLTMAGACAGIGDVKIGLLTTAQTQPCSVDE